MQGRSQNVYMFSGAASGRQRAHMVHPVSPSVICFANATSLVRGRLFEGRPRVAARPAEGTPQARILNKETRQEQILHHERQRAGMIPAF